MGKENMKAWIILIMIFMSLGVSIVSSHLAAKLWGREVRLAVFITVFILIWMCFWLGTG